MKEHPGPRRPKRFGEQDEPKYRPFKSEGALDIFDTLSSVAEEFGGMCSYSFKPDDSETDMTEYPDVLGVVGFALEIPCNGIVYDDLIGILGERAFHSELDDMLERQVMNRHARKRRRR